MVKKILGTAGIILLLLIALLCGSYGCQGAKPKASNTGKGYVRNVWQKEFCTYVTFEREDGMIFVYDFNRVPPVWAGMHATIDYQYYGSTNEERWCNYDAGSVQRWKD